MPLVVPRAQFRVLDERLRAQLKLLGLNADEAARPDDDQEAWMASRAAVDGYEAPAIARQRVTAALAHELASLTAQVTSLDPNLAKAVARTEQGIHEVVDRLIAKYARALAQREAATFEQRNRLRNLLALWRGSAGTRVRAAGVRGAPWMASLHRPRVRGLPAVFRPLRGPVAVTDTPRTPGNGADLATANPAYALEVLAFGPHPDDVELFCGGLLLQMADRGYRTGVVDLTRGEMASRGTPELRLQEAMAAAEILGLALRENLGLPDAGLDAASDLQLAPIVAILRRLRPELVVAPWRHDRHPDHEAASGLVTRALFLAGLRRYSPDLGSPFAPRQVLYYPMRHLAEPSFVVHISAVVERKAQAIRCHASQVLPRPDAPATLVGSALSLTALEYSIAMSVSPTRWETLAAGLGAGNSSCWAKAGRAAKALVAIRAATICLKDLYTWRLLVAGLRPGV